MEFKPGDLVRHKPTGEDWIVLRYGVDGAGAFVEPVGWPRLRARAGDCKMLQAGAYAHWDKFKNREADT